MKNRQLKKIYNRIYRRGEKRHYSKILFSTGVPPQVAEALKEISWRGKKVADVGCGAGLFAYLAKKAGAASVLGIDYSAEAIKIARQSYQLPGLEFRRGDLKDLPGRYDIIVSLGTLEHVDSPLATLKKLKKRLNKNGSIIIACPNWTNTRGYVLLTLHFLFDSPITLADKHYLTPSDFEKIATRLNMKLSWRTFDFNWGSGKKMIKDFRRRLPRVLPGNNNIRRFINWLAKHLPPGRSGRYGGAVALYHFR